MALTLSTTGLIIVTDSSLNSPQSPISFGGSITASVVEQIASFSVGTVSTAATLPVSPVLFAQIKNLHTSTPVAVRWTPNGGTVAVISTLQPSDYLQFMNTSGGITQLSFSATASMTVSMVLAG